MDAMQIAKLVMQIHANNVLNIDSIKNQIFLMGGAGETHVGFHPGRSVTTCNLIFTDYIFEAFSKHSQINLFIWTFRAFC
jgi:hypothetical protein